MAKYGIKEIADELILTAKGPKYYGNALYVARDIPSVTIEEQRLLHKASLRLELSPTIRKDLLQFAYRLKAIEQSC